MGTTIAIIVTQDQLAAYAGHNYKETWWGDAGIAKQTLRAIGDSGGDIIAIAYFDPEGYSDKYRYFLQVIDRESYYCRSLADLPVIIKKAMSKMKDINSLIALSPDTGFPMFVVNK
jgi:hypothetical protein